LNCVVTQIGLGSEGVISLADYKRMVSYMYQYENGVKRKNVGYARIEARNGICKITLHMQLLGQLDSIFPTYLIQRDKKNMELIYLGDTLLRNQVMDSKLTANETNIMNSGYSLTDMGGILLFLNDNIYFATEWDDRPVVANEVLDALRPRTVFQNSQDKKADTLTKSAGTKADYSGKSTGHEDFVSQGGIYDSGSRNEDEVVEQQGHLEEQQINQKADQYNEVRRMMDLRTPEQLTLEEELNIPKYKLPRGWKTVERLNKPMASEAMKHVDIIKEPKPEPVLEYQPKAEQEFEVEYRPKTDQETEYQLEAEQVLEAEYQQETDQDTYSDRGQEFEQYFYQGTQQDYQQDLLMEFLNGTQVDNNTPGDLLSVTDNQADNGYEAEVSQDNYSYQNYNNQYEVKTDIGKAEAAEAKTEEDIAVTKEDFEMEDQPDHPIAQHFFDHYPRIYPFEDNEILQCVKIEPKDIGMLPKETWVLSNNSFLMHGFYCYHHLIFAKRKDQSGCHYILGIPGIYHNRERFMARMFGFECFKSIRKRDLRQGDFGYWYLEVMF